MPSALEQRGAELVDEASSWDVLWADDRVDEVGKGAVRTWGSDFDTVDLLLLFASQLLHAAVAIGTHRMQCILALLSIS